MKILSLPERLESRLCDQARENAGRASGARRCMSQKCNRWPVLAVVLLASSLPGFARGQPAVACSGPEISLVAPGRERPRWLTLRAHLAEHLQALRDLDRCAQLTLRALGDGLAIEVRAGDGRTASRLVRSESQALRASEALLTLPPKPAGNLPAASAFDEPGADPPPPAPISVARIELGVGAAARLGGVPLFIAEGIAGFAEVSVDPWVLGVSARWDITTGLLTEPTLMDYYLMSGTVGVHVGRRFEVESASLALLLGPNLVLETQGADDGKVDIEGSAADVRLDFGARVAAPRQASFRVFASADCEFSPARLVKSHFVQPGLPALPSFSIGLALGFGWSGR